ncbi:fimbrial protein [Burkholderia sp. PAMC 28687]|uniref:fimbrial protein n=1 Tax=Burkholderia sp. PAMC 28687 TaxID=1795874 RepID=UPI0009EC4AB5|nr:fimbrial protein [Burkholderia sp. PAMC 28687]
MFMWPNIAFVSSATSSTDRSANNRFFAIDWGIQTSFSRHLFFIALTACIVFSATSARASLTCTYPVNVSKVLAAGTISVPASPAVGATVKTLAPDAFQIPCRLLSSAPVSTSADEYAIFKTTASLASGFSDVYATNVPGLGVRFAFNAPACNAVNATLDKGEARLTCPVNTPVGGPYVNIDIASVVSLVTTGPVAAGASSLLTIPTVTITYQHSDSPGNSYQFGSLYTGTASGTLSTATCSVQTDAPVVALPTVSVRGFSGGLGTTAGAQSFNLSFACATGAQVSIVITDAVDPSNRSNVLNLASESTAKGVGVQVLRDKGTPVSFGPDAAGPNVPNQWLIGASPNGVLVLPLTAQYIRTGNVTAGSIKALATFTMSYQ